MTRKERALETRDKIYQETLRLIQEKGYENVLIEEITQSAGIAKGTFYYYFNSKDDLLYYTYKHVDKYYESAFEIAKNESDYNKMIDVFIRTAYKGIEDLGRELLRALSNNIYKLEGSDAFLDKDRHLYTSLKHFMDKGISEGIIDPSHDANYYVELILVALVGADNYWTLPGQTSNLCDLAADMVHTLIRGFSK